MLEQRLGQRPQRRVGVPVVGDGAQRGGDLLVGPDGQPRGGERDQEGVPQGRLLQPPGQPRLLVGGEPAEPLDVPCVLGAGDELELAELHRLEAAGRREPLAELQEVLRGHRLQHVDLLDQRALDDVHPLQQVLGPPQAAAALTRAAAGPAEHRLASGLDLVQELLEPQLVDLVDRDEEQLVVRGRGAVSAGLAALRVEQLGELEVGAVGQLRALLPEGHEVLATHDPNVPHGDRCSRGTA